MKTNNITNYNSPVAQNIVRILDEKGLKQKKIAQLSGFSEQGFCDAINGRKILKIKDVKLIASALDVSIDDLFKTVPKELNVEEH